MKLLLCGKKDEYLIINEYMKTAFPNAETVFCDNSEEVLGLLTEVNYDMAMVTFDGAEGMEMVMLLRRMRPDLPVAWISDDSGFAIQAYRMRTAFFHSKPLTIQVLKKALQKCSIPNRV